jgi:hypothetical protein
MLATGPFPRLRIDQTIAVYIKMKQDKFLVTGEEFNLSC